MREAESLAADAYRSAVTGTPYLAVPDPCLPEDHPRKFFDARMRRPDRASTSACPSKISPSDTASASSGPSGGFGEIILPVVQEGSSFYPGKINPVIPETMLQCCFQVLGRERATRLALERGELNLNVFEGGAAANIFDATDMMRRSVEAFVERCLKNIVANRKHCRELVSKSRF